ncbi:MAG: PadR family transcriptional regulator [Actinobacteria bacterium]|nr:PadR family transcriptional regulator [Actinomycetota bacterium]
MSVKYAILGLLHYEDMHGYRIKKHIEHNFGHMWTINYGQIFTALRKMEDEGLVVMRDLVPSDNGGPRRKVYSITPAGREEFSRWLASAPEKEMLIRDPFLLRFVFFGFGDPRRALEILEGQIESYEKQLRRRRDNLERWRHHGDYVRLMAELGVQFNELYLEWLRRAHRELSAGLRESGKGNTRRRGEARGEVAKEGRKEAGSKAR